jgi:Asp/Glu/hydantoin racemase
MAKIAAIYTGAVLVAPLSGMLKEALPGCTVMNMLDDSLIADCIAADGLTKDVTRRLCNLYQIAYEAGADCILNTCSSVGEVVDIGREIVPIPIVRIDDAMAKLAVETASRVGVVATLRTTLGPTVRLIQSWASKLGKTVTVVEGLADGAFAAASAGEAETHDRLIREAAQRIAGDCDAIVLAQGSMAKMEVSLRRITGMPVYSSPALGIAAVKAIFET